MNLERFIIAQHQSYASALKEISNGRKTSHWMWYIFPQLEGLGHSEMAKRYAISSEKEADAFLQHPILGKRLLEISRSLLELPSSSATAILGTPDELKLRSCMSLFASLATTDAIFQAVLDKFFHGKKDPKTLSLLEKKVEQ